MRWAELFVYDESSPSFLTNKVNRPPRGIEGEHAGYMREDGYWMVGHEYHNVLIHRVIYELMYGVIPDGMQVDHKDGNPSNNRKENLRLVIAKVNQRNMKRSKNNTSGVTGVVLTVVKRPNKNFIYWTACWETLDGISKRANFSIDKHGDATAKQMAIAKRQQEIIKLNECGAGYSERHGE